MDNNVIKEEKLEEISGGVTTGSITQDEVGCTKCKMKGGLKSFTSPDGRHGILCSHCGYIVFGS